MAALVRLRIVFGRLRPLLVARNLVMAPRVLRFRGRMRELGTRRSVLRTLRHADFRVHSDERPWLDREGSGAAIATDPRSARVGEELRAKLKRWPEDGYMVLDGFFDPELIDRINGELASLIGSGALRFSRAGNRVRNAYRRSAAVAEAIDDRGLRDLLGAILGVPVGVWQTISFFTGSRQAAHSDAFHMMTEPRGYLVAIWVALEDITPDCGPVFYLPGSHRLPYVTTEDLDGCEGSRLMVADKSSAYEARIAEIAAASRIEPQQFLARKGDVLIWHANLLHGGSPIADPELTRRSLVAHFYGEGAVRYHEIAEHLSLV